MLDDCQSHSNAQPGFKFARSHVHSERIFVTYTLINVTTLHVVGFPTVV